ncbi:molybdenum cofactor guanylyltransferase [Neptunicella sp. SCSIO 80796]|uniref:molybdenum cofactor guanylyltransferase n=1 Tax=Neptunicella plasticusilytica TaxID=3117012 RepID=UPI003A4D75E3
MKIAGVVLAGGLSSRMGQDKAELLYQGKTLLVHCIERLSQSHVEQVIISRNRPDCVADIYPQSGPLGGIHAVMSQYAFDGYLFLPVDMPLVDEALLSALISAGAATRRISCYSSSCLPVYIPYRDDIVDFIQQQLQQNGKRSIVYLLEQFEHQRIACPNDSMLVNINTLQDWQALV